MDKTRQDKTFLRICARLPPHHHGKGTLGSQAARKPGILPAGASNENASDHFDRAISDQVTEMAAIVSGVCGDSKDVGSVSGTTG